MIFSNLIDHSSIKRLSRTLRVVYRKTIFTFGIILAIGVTLSFTDIPYYQYYWLGTHKCDLQKKPDYIVLLGGGGMPSPDGFIRTYYAAGAWKQSPESKVIIAIPPDTSHCIGSPDELMAKEIIMRGVDSTRIIFEPRGYNTYSQAVEILKLFDPNALDTVSLRLITTPEHMFRSVKVFRKAGFKHVGGTPAFEISLNEKKLTRKKVDDSFALNFRYNMWSYLKYEITVIREYFAILYYKAKGWI